MRSPNTSAVVMLTRFERRRYVSFTGYPSECAFPLTMRIPLC